MKMQFRLFRRGDRYYIQNYDTGEQKSLHASDKAEAGRLLNSKNEATMLAGSKLMVARAYMAASDPELSSSFGAARAKENVARRLTGIKIVCIEH